ncbi:MAG: exodeoxyribonuclease VII large subunit, partial [Saprospiraceae bacterium]|nr:exodeoxyribonuclease VII large subunit [Saprospiraceae bacterium]
ISELEAFSLLEVNQYIKRVLALNFEDPFWVSCEINQASQSRSNMYLELIEKAEDSDEILAKNSATIWYRQMSFIRKKLGDLTDSILTDGVKVKLKVNVEYSERYGLSLNILDVDASFTLGQFELNRQKVIQKLKNKGLLDVNKSLPLPAVIQKVAVISSSTAAGYQDFIQHLNDNPYGYDYQCKLFPAAMQGQNTEREVVAALRSIDTDQFHAVCIIRGGGSKLDLSAFDNYNIAFEIANYPLPVFTGIGHDIDMTVTDIVAYNILKTPTAVADFFIEHNLRFESDVINMQQIIEQTAQNMLINTRMELQQITQAIRTIPSVLIRTKYLALEHAESASLNSTQSIIQRRHTQLEHVQSTLELLNPTNVLQRGFALVKQDKNYIGRLSDLKSGMDHLNIEFHDGTLQTKISKDGE